MTQYLGYDTLCVLCNPARQNFKFPTIGFTPNLAVAQSFSNQVDLRGSKLPKRNGQPALIRQFTLLCEIAAPPNGVKMDCVIGGDKTWWTCSCEFKLVSHTVDSQACRTLYCTIYQSDSPLNSLVWGAISPDKWCFSISIILQLLILILRRRINSLHLSTNKHVSHHHATCSY